ncbi:hypothetical protein DCAR_0417433 [Daucus carota subsp. sativus]|uniref:Uncharacterized protein n=1 Tax=Daucus carota subsp. sativus TaxID=79200 RepID=A0A165YG76_DAUCS|nr:hypothetical protein DCAR_0417433 [Daucus carota subsp. sativus]
MKYFIKTFTQRNALKKSSSNDSREQMPDRSLMPIIALSQCYMYGTIRQLERDELKIFNSFKI